jgi:hypothetical protein
MRTHHGAVGLLALGLALVAVRAHAQTESGTPPETPEDVVGRLYELVTFEAGQTPDWVAVRSIFLDQAVIVLRMSRDSLPVLSVDEFVAEFQAFIEQAKVRETGFSETVVTMRSMVFGDIAHILVLYEASIPGSARGPQQGVDSFQLIRTEGGWRIASVVNEVPTDARPVPEELMPPPGPVAPPGEEP